MACDLDRRIAWRGRKAFRRLFGGYVDQRHLVTGFRGGEGDSIAHLAAAQGGYPTHLIPETFDHILYADAKMLLDALAWQAVGETQGWDGSKGTFKYARTVTHRDGTKHNLEVERRNKPTRLNWKRNWRRFIDHLADGNDIDTALPLIK